MNHQDFKDDRNGRLDSEDLPEEILQALGRDEDFFPDDREIDRLVARVDRRIDMVEPTVVTPVPWRSIISVAAAVVLLLGVALVEKLPETGGSDASWLTWTYEPLFETDNRTELLASALTADYETLDDQEINVLMHDYTSTRTYDVGAGLLGDLSQDELLYLEENFDVGDLL